MTGPSRRGGRHASLTSLFALAAATAAVLAGCGPESYRRGESTDARGDLARAGGDGGGDAGADVPLVMDAAADVGDCSVRGTADGTDAGVPTFDTSWTFDDATGLQGWMHVGQPADVVAATTQKFDGQDGYPAAGSARVSVPFNGAGQQIAFGYNFPTPRDLSAQVMSARVRLDSCNPPGAVVVALAYKSVVGVYEFAATPLIELDAANGWTTLTMSIDNPGGFIDMSRHDADGGAILPDPTTTLELDIIIQSNLAPFTTADISVDSVGLSRAGTGPRD